VSFRWHVVVLQPCLLLVGLVLAVGFLQVVEVVPVGLGQVPELLWVGSVLVVGFLRVVVVVVPVRLGLVLVPKKVAWN
jgi:hypothetical protein